MKLSIKGRWGWKLAEYMTARKIQRKVQDGEWSLHRNMGQIHTFVKGEEDKDWKYFQ